MWTRHYKPRYPLAHRCEHTGRVRPTLEELLQTGVKVVICDFFGKRDRKGNQSKVALVPGFQEKRPPGFKRLKKHIDQDGLLAIIPATIGMVVLDVDRGDASTIIANYPPWFAARSNRPGRIHLYYRNPEGLRFPKEWTGPQGTGGELIQGMSGYAILWQDTMQELVEAFHDPLNRGGVDFGQVARALRWVKAERAGASSGSVRLPVDGPPDLSKVQPGDRNAGNFDALRFWAYEHWRDYSTKEDLLLELQARALAGRDSMPDVDGPGTMKPDPYTENHALQSAAQVAEGVWQVFVTREGPHWEKYLASRNYEISGALRADSRPFSEGGQSWESSEMENPQWSRHSARCHHVSGEPCRGDPALNHDPETQRYRRSCRTDRQALEVRLRRKGVAFRSALGDDVAKMATTFGVTRRTIQRDLASIEELPSRRTARRAQQAEGERRRRHAADEARQRSGNPQGRERGEGQNVSSMGDMERERGDTPGTGLEPPYLQSPELSFKKDAPRRYYYVGGAYGPPHDKGLVSPTDTPGPDPPGESLSDGQ